MHSSFDNWRSVWILLAAVAFPLEFIPMVGLLLKTPCFARCGLEQFPPPACGLPVSRRVPLLQDYVVSPQLLSAGMKLHPLLVIFESWRRLDRRGCRLLSSVPVLAGLRIVYRQLLPQTPPVVVAPTSLLLCKEPALCFRPRTV